MLGCLVMGAALAQGVEPEAATLVATGRQEQVITVEQFGRYAIEVSSSQGTAVQLVDRMMGPGPVRGQAGVSNGRIDAFLEAGETKVVALSSPQGSGTAQLKVAPFAELSGARDALPRRERVSATLQDLERRSWWLDAPTDNPVVSLEVVGRFLGDVRLWRDGTWLVDAQPRCDTVEPAEGQPQRRCRLSVRLEPGALYLASAYGGPAEPWANESDAAPLSIQWDVPSIPPDGRRVGRISAIGLDRFRVPPGADTFHVSLPENAPVALSATMVQDDPFVDGGRTAVIDQDSRFPEAQVRVGGSGDRIVTVRGPAGQPYVLTWFDAASLNRSIRRSGRLLVSTLHAGSMEDFPDPTGLIVKERRGDRPARTPGYQGVVISKKQRYERTFNLKDATALLLDVRSAGRYGVRMEGVDGALAIDPMLLNPPEDFRPSKLKRDSLEVDLERGLHVLRLEADEPGIATVRIAHESEKSWLRQVFGRSEPAEAARPAIQFLDLDLVRRASHRLLLMSPREVPAGLIMRSLPVPAREGVPLSLLPGETLKVPIRLDEPGRLAALAPDGTALPMTAGRKDVPPDRTLSAGVYDVRVSNPGEKPVLASVGLVEPPAITVVPTLSKERLRSLPQFASLSAAAPAHLSLEANGQQTYLVNVEQDGLYRVQSTGLLATSGSMRTRMRTGFADASANGVGRNFLISDFLRSGLYQLTVKTQGRSAGALGLSLQSSPIMEGGALTDRVPARATLRAGEGVRYTFEMSEPGRVRVVSKGRGGVVECRFEDADGWPLLAPRVPCERTLDLPAGRYVMVGLPTEVEHRRITTLTRLGASPPPREGHGPHALALGASATFVWREPVDGGGEPDVWRVAVPAPVEATVSLSPEMAGEIVQNDTVLGELTAGRGWTGSWAPGTVDLRLRGARQGTGVSYTVAVATKELVVGQERRVAVPVEMPLSVGEAAVVRVASRGNTDVRARLLDAGGQVLAANDDRPDDWNFQITTRLEAGQYRLRVDAIDGSGETWVAMSAPRAVVLEPLAAGKRREVATADGAAVMPLVLPAERSVVVVEARAPENVGVSLEVENGASWRSLGTATGRSPTLVARRDGSGSAVRLRVWSEDGRGGAADVKVSALRVRRLGSGSVDVGRGWGAAKPRGSGGLFDVGRNRQGLVVCPEAGAACTEASSAVVGASDDGLVLARRGGRVRAARVTLAPRASRVVRMGARRQWVDVARGEGPSVVLARASAGRPAVALGEGPIGFSNRGAIGVSLEGEAVARVWEATGVPGGVDAEVTAVPLSSAEVQDAVRGRREIRVRAGGAVRLALPDGAHDVGLTLEAGLAAVASSRPVAWADAASRWVQWSEVSGSITLLNPTDREGLVAVDVVAERSGGGLSPDQPAEWVALRAGERWLRLVPSPEGRLRVQGASATLLRPNGELASGPVLEVGEGGWVQLVHGPGPVTAWVDDGAWRTETVSESAPSLQAGGMLALAGAQQAVQLRHSGPGVAHLAIPCPAVAILRDGEHVRREVLSAGDFLDVWMAKGAATVELRAFSGASLHGAVTLTVSQPQPLGEGVGPEVLVGPGLSRWFALDVEREGPLGIGVQAEADRVQARVVDATGRTVSEGVVQRVELTPGRWFVALSVAADREPVRARPAVVGLERPPEGPPEDVVRQYINR